MELYRVIRVKKSSYDRFEHLIRVLGDDPEWALDLILKIACEEIEKEHRLGL